jgi:hypothetical protein
LIEVIARLRRPVEIAHIDPMQRRVLWKRKQRRSPNADKEQQTAQSRHEFLQKEWNFSRTAIVDQPGWHFP